MRYKDEQMINKMLSMQDAFNNKIHDDWKFQGYAWEALYIIELMECAAHLGVEHWKKIEVNLAQAKLELVDAYHFLLSGYLEELREPYPTRECISVDRLSTFYTDVDFLLNASKSFYDPRVFHRAWKEIGGSISDLFNLYIAKNVLNVFRQDNGYKTGDYIKTWTVGQTIAEDNVFLFTEAMQLVHGLKNTEYDSIDDYVENYSDALYERLAGLYTLIGEVNNEG